MDSGLNFVRQSATSEDIVLWTGDISWYRLNISKADEMAPLRPIAQAFREAIPADVPVVPAIGNHDTFLINMFGSPDVESKWVVDATADAWSLLLPQDTLAQAKRNGLYYTVSPKPGLLVVVLNGVLFHEDNELVEFHLDQHAMEHQLDWFEKTMDEAAASNTTVWIISHVPFGYHEGRHDGEIVFGPQICQLRALERYLSIVRKHGERIALQAFGHQHMGGFRFVQLNSSVDAPLASSPQLVAPSLTPSENKHPALWRYILNDEHSLVAIEQWILNLMAANQAPSDAHWELQARFPDDLGIPDLSVGSWAKFAARLRTDDAFFLKIRHLLRTRWSDRDACDRECLHDGRCATLYADPALWQPCFESA